MTHDKDITYKQVKQIAANLANYIVSAITMCCPECGGEEFTEEALRFTTQPFTVVRCVMEDGSTHLDQDFEEFDYGDGVRPEAWECDNCKQRWEGSRVEFESALIPAKTQIDGVGTLTSPVGCDECVHGALIDQTYGEAGIPEGWVPVQRCDACDVFDGDEAAARWVSMHLTERFVRGTVAWFAADEDDGHGDWAVLTNNKEQG